jgi:hypothetical protein
MSLGMGVWLSLPSPAPHHDSSLSAKAQAIPCTLNASPSSSYSGQIWVGYFVRNFLVELELCLFVCPSHIMVIAIIYNSSM